MDRYPRVILGYHGCKPEFAEAMIRGELSVADWKPSANAYDWLGSGIYFWEHAPHRARDWMGKGGVIGAIISLGYCLDLTDTWATDLLSQQFDVVRKSYEESGQALPVNRGLRGDLDCLVINELVAAADQSGIKFDTVRSPFLEGKPVYRGSRILRQSHIQIAVRDSESILGVFLPNQPPTEVGA